MDAPHIVSTGRDERITALRLVDIDGERVEVRPARLEEIIDLRHEVLRDGLPREAAVFPGDDAPSSRHYSAVRGGRIICCATVHTSAWDGDPAWQLRGMATAPGLRGRGAGRAVMGVLEADLLAASPVRLLWCNARTPAAGFYQSLGWEIRSDVFDIPTAGPHYRMTKWLADPAPNPAKHLPAAAPAT